MGHTHYFRSISDASEFVRTHKNAKHAGDGFVVIKCASQEEVEYWEGCEEFGPFPCDGQDMR